MGTISTKKHLVGLTYHPKEGVVVKHRLNIELDLQSLVGLLCTQLYSLAEAPQFRPSPRIWAHIYEGANGQPR